MARASLRPEALGGAPALTPAEVRAAAAELSVTLSAEQGERLARFAELLARWNAVHNLTAIAAPGQVLSHHLLDSLAILQPIHRIFGEKPLRILDVGAGGGLPGIPLAVARPDWHLTLVDKVAKKVAFLTQAKVELALANVECRHARVEALQAGPFDLIVARAFASLVEFVGLTRHLLTAGGWWAAMKGALPTDELAELQRGFPQVRLAGIVKLDVPRLGAERHLILLQRP